jgi:hypothetical protein
MHSALFVVKVPAENQSRQAWRASFRGHCQQLALQKGALQLAENVWLINFQENPAALATLVHTSEHYPQTPYMLLPLGSEPQWLPAGASPVDVSHSPNLITDE